MAEDQKNTQKEFQPCCEGMPFADMMRKMMEAKKSGSSFKCTEMISQMMQMCCGTREKKEEPTPGSKENPVANP
jgi:hypothetical protein